MIFRFQRFFAVFSARNKEFYRDKGALGWSLLFPILIIISFGYIFDLDEDDLYKAGVIGIARVSEIDSFQQILVQEKDAALRKLSNHSVDIVLQPESAGKIQYWVHAASPRSAVAEKLLQSEAYRNPELEILKNTVKGEKASYIEWLFPGLLAMNVMWMALWGVGWVIVRQRKLGILKRFKASPLTSLEYLLAQIVSRLVVLSVTGGLIFGLGHLIYPFKTSGSYLDLFLIYILGCFALSALGLIVSARMTSDELASGLLNMISFPMMFLSEIWFSLEGSSAWVHSLARLMPLWHITDGMRKIMLYGADLADLQGSILTLVLLSLIFISLGSFSFKWTNQ